MNHNPDGSQGPRAPKVRGNWRDSTFARIGTWPFRAIFYAAAWFWRQLQDWRTLGLDFVERAVVPLRRPKAVIYFALAIIGLGSAGVWATWGLHFGNLTSPHEIALHAATLAFAIAVTSIVDVVIDGESSGSLKLLICAIAVCVLVPCGYLGYNHVFLIAHGQQVSGLTLALVLAPVWLTWWLANAADPRFQTSTDPSNAIGGRDLGGG